MLSDHFYNIGKNISSGNPLQVTLGVAEAVMDATMIVPPVGIALRAGAIGLKSIAGAARAGFFSRGLGRQAGEVGVENLVSTGGRQLTSAKATLSADQEAASFYNQVRVAKSNSDVIQIAKNTGMPEYRIQRIKEHVFINEHTLSGARVAQFDPYIEISDAWSRLQSGNFVEQDIQLLHHEYFESRFEGIFKTDYTTAHNAAINSGRTWNPDEFISITPTINWRS